jgi:hypothetical protein
LRAEGGGTSIVGDGRTAVVRTQKGAPVSRPEEGSSGDYSYDLAHEALEGATQPGPGDGQPRPTVVHPGGTTDRGEDYGYDEAHSF